MIIDFSDLETESKNSTKTTEIFESNSKAKKFKNSLIIFIVRELGNKNRFPFVCKHNY